MNKRMYSGYWLPVAAKLLHKWFGVDTTAKVIIDLSLMRNEEACTVLTEMVAQAMAEAYKRGLEENAA